MRQLKKKRQQCKHRFFFSYALKRGKFNILDNLNRAIHHFLRATFQLELPTPQSLFVWRKLKTKLSQLKQETIKTTFCEHKGDEVQLEEENLSNGF